MSLFRSHRKLNTVAVKWGKGRSCSRATPALTPFDSNSTHRIQFAKKRRRGEMSMGTYTIAVLPGDGIGPEVIGQALAVLRNIADRFGHSFATTEARVGVAAIEAEGDAISDTTMELCQRSDAIL